MWSKHVSKQVCPLWILRPKRETHDVEVGHWSHPNPGADGRTPRSSWNLFLECYNVINHGKPHKKLSHYQHNWVVTMGRNYHGYYLQWVVETIRNHFDAVYHIFFILKAILHQPVSLQHVTTAIYCSFDPWPMIPPRPWPELSTLLGSASGSRLEDDQKWSWFETWNLKRFDLWNPVLIAYIIYK